ncbi:MAG: pilus assembly protein [Planctomycetes bacterium]|nr:pilus assembly protein [Planctomycetota bacterium]
MKTGTRRSGQGERGQMAVEMALLLPIYILFFFIVLVYGDWFIIAHRVDIANYSMTRGEGNVTAGDVEPYIRQLEDMKLGSRDQVKPPSFAEQGSPAEHTIDAKLTYSILGLGSSSCDTGLSDIDFRQATSMGMFLQKGLKRNRSGGRTQVAFRYDARRYFYTFDRELLRPTPTLRNSSTATVGSIRDDSERKIGDWNLHPIEGLNVGRGFNLMVQPHGPAPHLFIPMNAWYMRHLGWRGYDYSYVPGMAFIDMAGARYTYHPIQFENNNFVHENILLKLGF